MSNKILMAEGLDFIRQAETMEYELDKRMEMIKDNMKKMKKDIGKLVHDYESVYRTYVKGLEVLNYVRHNVNANAGSSPQQSVNQGRQMEEFCGAKMVAYMDRCNGIRKKLSQLCIPVDQVAIPMEGFCCGEEIISSRNLVLNKGNTTFAQKVNLSRGTYVLTVLNNDDYTFAAPDVTVQLTIHPENPATAAFEGDTMKAEIPCLMGWRRVIGTTGSAVDVRVTASGKRDAHVSVVLTQWQSEILDVSVSKAKLGQATPSSSGSKASPASSAPPSRAVRNVRPVAVKPHGLNCEERLELLTLSTDTWPADNVVTTRLPPEPQRFLQEVFSLPLPTDLG